MKASFLTPLVVASALFIENMDSTVIATSLPAIAVDLGVDAILLKLAFTAYLLSLAIFIPASGWAADRFGARLVFRIAIVVFTMGSIFCAFTGSFAGFIAARAVQGLGGAMMVPVGRLVILRTVPKSDLMQALSFLTIPALIGPIIGPIVGGFITTYFHWRWIFWINLPFGLLAVALATRYLPDPRAETSPPLDTTGFLLSGFGLATFIFGLTIVGRDILPNWAIAVLLGLALLAIDSERSGVDGVSLSQHTERSDKSLHLARVGTMGRATGLHEGMEQNGFMTTRGLTNDQATLVETGSECRQFLRAVWHCLGQTGAAVKDNNIGLTDVASDVMRRRRCGRGRV